MEDGIPTKRYQAEEVCHAFTVNYTSYNQHFIINISTIFKKCSEFCISK